MRTDIYAARMAQAMTKIREAVERLSAIEAFADVPALLDAAKHKDRDAAALFEREAFATIIERAVAFITTAPPIDDDGQGDEGDDNETDDDDDGLDGDDDAGEDDGQTPTPEADTDGAGGAAAAKAKSRRGGNKGSTKAKTS